MQKRTDLDELAERFAEPARQAFERLSPSFVVRSPFCTLYGLIALLALDGSEASAQLLRTLAPKLQRASRTSSVTNPMRNIAYFLRLFGTSDEMVALEQELQQIETARQQRCESALLAELLEFPIKDRVDFHAVAHLTKGEYRGYGRPEHHLLKVDLCPGDLDDWRVEIEKPQRGSEVSIRRGDGAVHNDLPDLHSLFDLPNWLAEVVAKTGWQFEAEHAQVSFGRYKKAKKVLVDWLVSELG